MQIGQLLKEIRKENIIQKTILKENIIKEKIILLKNNIKNITNHYKTLLEKTI